MSGSIKFFLLVVVLSAAFDFYLGYRSWRIMEESGQLSCLGSIANATGTAWASGQLNLNDRSRELTRDEIEALIKQGKIGDCGRHQYIFENVHISIGEVNKKSEARIRIWIPGDDGVSGTSDDLVFPWEENNK